MLDHRRNLDQIADNAARAAYEHIIERATAVGLRLENNTGFVAAVKMYDDLGEYPGRSKYAFSIICNRGHLTFYIRKPAHDRWRGLHEAAEVNFPAVFTNNGRETKIYLRTKQDVDRLADWLFTMI